jgi:integrase
MAKVAKRRGRYVLDFYDHQGKRRWITFPAGTTEKKAKEKLREIEDQVARGVYIPDKKIPTFIEVAENWLQFKKPDIRPATVEMYEGHIKNHFTGFFSIPINRISTTRIERFISKRRVAGMNITTLRKLIVTLNQIFKYAVRHQYISENPVTNAERPKRQQHDKKPEIKVLNPQQINLLLDAVDDPKYNTFFMLSIISGARQGELMGLKWSDVYWNDNQIHIQRSFNHNRMQLPKTKTSNRKIDLGPGMMNTLRRWRLQSDYSGNDDFIFPNKAGKPMCQSHMLSRHFFPALKRAGLPKMRFHDLRHTFASLKIEQGENLVYISKQMGHSSTTVTSTIYAHLINDKNFESACGLEEMIFEKNGSSLVAETKKGFTGNPVNP